MEVTNQGQQKVKPEHLKRSLLAIPGDDSTKKLEMRKILSS